MVMELYPSGIIDHSDVNIALDMQNLVRYVRRGAYRLDLRKKERIYKSMADYLLYAKLYYGIEFSMFSFNESDLGIDVLYTPQEHAEFIKECGTWLAGLTYVARRQLRCNDFRLHSSYSERSCYS